MVVESVQDIYLARQPILNRRLRIEAFELLYRDTDADHARIVDEEQATSRVVLNVLNEMGIETVVGDRNAFINVDRNFVLDGGLDDLSHPALAFEITATGDDPELLAGLRRLAARGRRLALDNYRGSGVGDTLLETVEFVKIDLLAPPAVDLPMLLRHLRGQGKTSIATRIEDRPTLDYCLELDFDYFQGYHFSQPKLLRFRGLAANQLALLQLVGRLNDPEVELGTVESLIARDVSLSYKLLRHLNSAYFGLPRSVESIHQAVVMLGLDHIRSWATLISLADMGGNSGEAIQTALIRAEMCQRLAEDISPEVAPGAFTVGLLSTLDLLTQSPLEAVLEALPLAEPIRRALLARQGALGRVLDCTLAYERGDWATVDNSGCRTGRVREAYFAALSEANRICQELP